MNDDYKTKPVLKLILTQHDIDTLHDSSFIIGGSRCPSRDVFSNLHDNLHKYRSKEPITLRGVHGFASGW